MYSREDILAKIKEWSKENDGKTPSEKVFFDYANMGIYDLKKLGWPFYGALVQEAGLQPNKFDKTKYNRGELCDLFIATIRENDRWPTRGDLDVKHYQNPDFPSYPTFISHFGLTGDLAKAILNHIDGKKGYENIENICTPIATKYKDITSESTERKAEEVYMYKYTNQSQPIKVGRSNDAFTRGIQLSAGGHDKLILLHSIKTDDSVGVEQYWHNRFRQLGREELANEWFRLKPEDIKAFKRWKKIF